MRHAAATVTHNLKPSVSGQTVQLLPRNDGLISSLQVRMNHHPYGSIGERCVLVVRPRYGMRNVRLRLHPNTSRETNMERKLHLTISIDQVSVNKIVAVFLAKVLHLPFTTHRKRALSYSARLLEA